MEGFRQPLFIDAPHRQAGGRRNVRFPAEKCSAVFCSEENKTVRELLSSSAGGRACPPSCAQLHKYSACAAVPRCGSWAPFLCCFLSIAQRQQAWAGTCATFAEHRATASWPELVWIFLKCVAEITLAWLPLGDLVSYFKKEPKLRKKKIEPVEESKWLRQATLLFGSSALYGWFQTWGLNSTAIAISDCRGTKKGLFLLQWDS